MVCCTIIAALLGLLMRPLLALRSSPLAWRPNGTDPASGSFAIRATSRLESFAHAFDGWRFLVRNEPNMRIHLGLAALATLMGTWLWISPSEWRWLIVAMAMVLAAEALNTAVEQACNAISRSYNPLIKAAKDVAAGAVLIAALAAALIGASVFLPHVLSADQPSIILPVAMCGETR